MDKVGPGIAVSALVCLAFGPDAGGPLTIAEYFGLVSSADAQTPAPNYTYTVIADGTNCSNLGNPVLNNAGQVAFAAGAPCPTAPTRSA